jgi:photosystem II stability/assembly factor-like uncharacterized protein
MKRLTLVLFSLLFTHNIYSQSGWFWQNPLPQGNRINCVKFVNAFTAYAVTSCGTILKTSNKGDTWSISFINDELYLTSLSSTDSLKLYVCSSNGSIYKTSNGGMNWFISFQSSLNQDFKDINFTSQNTGYVFGDKSYRTTNTGENWIPMYSNIYHEISYFLNDNTGFVCGGNTIEKTNNGGLNWQICYSNSNQGFKAVYFINSQTGVAVGTKVMRTTNQGITWQEPEYVPSGQFTSVTFIDQNTGIAVGTNFSSIYTSNAGVSWEGGNVLGVNRYSITSNRNEEFLAVGEHGLIVKSPDRGHSWFMKSNSMISNVKSMYFLNDETGFCLGYGGNVLKTINGGSSWNNLTLNRELYSIHFINVSTGFIGAAGMVYKTSNQGASWNKTDSIIYGVAAFYFLAENLGYLVTSYGGVYKTVNNGSNWTNICNLNYSCLDPLYFANEQTGYILGYSAVMKSTNGGVNWFGLVGGLTNYFTSMVFVNQKTGFVSGDNFRVFKTANSGTNWIKVFEKDGGTKSKLFFINESTGFIAGRSLFNSEIFKTTNSGMNWNKENFSYDGEVNCLFFPSPLIGYIGGDNGEILKTTNGGEPIGITQIGNQVPDKFILHQNYPNPFNPSTKIKFEIPANGRMQMTDMKIVVYDVIGREITTLVNEPLNPGTYEAEWNASAFASGVYFCMMLADDYKQTKKMVLIK